MFGKNIYTTWAPPGAEWAQFAKPGLFVHMDEFSLPQGEVLPFDIPAAVFLNRKDTAFIVDLPGATSVEAGLTMAKHGFRPVPLYNGIHEKNIGGLHQAVDNAPIINALHGGAGYLLNRIIDDSARPAFLLDYNRNAEVANSFSTFDNRWSIELEDFPAAAFIREKGLKRVFVWTQNHISRDLEPILDSYRDSGLEVKVYCNINSAFIHTPMRAALPNTLAGPDSHALTKDRIRQKQDIAAIQEEARKFENGRFALLLITLMGLINLVFMFFIRYEPILWTAPTITWLTYLWVDEWIGDAIAIWMAAQYLVLYLMCQRYRVLMKASLMLVAIETVVLLIYAGIYGFATYTGYSFPYGAIVFGFPVIVLVFLIKGSLAAEKLRTVTNEKYFQALDALDQGNSIHDQGYHAPRRRHFRGFRGYGGYGGSGRGGYSGGGYRGGYGGGYGGGFGG